MDTTNKNKWKQWNAYIVYLIELVEYVFQVKLGLFRPKLNTEFWMTKLQRFQTFFRYSIMNYMLRVRNEFYVEVKATAS